MMAWEESCKLRTLEDHWKDDEASFMRMAELTGLLTPERIDLITQYRSVLRRIYYRGASAGLCAATTVGTPAVIREIIDHATELS